MAVEPFWQNFWTLIFFKSRQIDQNWPKNSKNEPKNDRNLIFIIFWSIYVFLVNFGQFDEKNRSQPRKVQKISMSKNGVKSALRPLFKELWAILGFSKTRGFTSVILTQKMYFDPKNLKKIGFYVCFQSSKMMIFKKKCRYTIIVIL